MENLIPKLRFPEFEGEWEKKKLGDVAENISSGKSKTKEICGSYPLYGSTGLIGYSNINDYSGEKILIARVGANAGSLYKVEGEYSVSDNTLMLDLSNEIDVNFIYSNLIKINLNKLVFGSGQPLITGGQLKSFEIYLPNFSEQQKIATFLTSVDEKLQALKKKKSLLEQYKKGVMQKIFSQELRFKDENGNDFPEWEEKSLGEVAIKKSSNIAANKIEENFGEYIIYGASGVLKTVDFYEEENDYISIVKDGAGVGRLLYCKGKSSVLGTMEIIKPINNINTYFLFCLLRNIDFTKYITGSTIPHIYFKDYKIEICGIPSFSEQTLIANFLSAIDYKINHCGEQIAKMEVWKKGLLQGMFC
jgi:type I restriction enzyme S subunit